jgi:hypothetical protein
VRPPKEVTIENEDGGLTIRLAGSHPSGILYIYKDKEIEFCFSVSYGQEHDKFDTTINAVYKTVSGGYIEIPLVMRQRILSNIVSFFKSRNWADIYQLNDNPNSVSVGFGWEFVK